MKDLIDRQKAIRNICNEDCHQPTPCKWKCIAIEELESLPSVQPRKGEWIKDTKRFGEDNYHCSVCSAVLEEDDVKWRNNYFCYHCGAKMRKVGDAE